MNDSTVRRKVKWESAAETNVGTTRAINEDAVLSRPDIALWAVADGMGGHAVGDLASQLILEALENVQLLGKNLDEKVNEVESAVLLANQKILNYSNASLGGKTMGSTLVLLLIVGQVGVCLWAGDSRLYLSRSGKIHQLTRDHSRVEELIKQGLLKAEEAKNHVESNVITRAVGVDHDLCLEMITFEVKLKDTFILCSDGLYNVLDEYQMEHALHAIDTEKAANNLINKALTNGTSDNVSAVVIKGQYEKSVQRERLSLNELYMKSH